MTWGWFDTFSPPNESMLSTLSTANRAASWAAAGDAQPTTINAASTTRK